MIEINTVQLKKIEIKRSWIQFSQEKKRYILYQEVDFSSKCSVKMFSNSYRLLILQEMSSHYQKHCPRSHLANDMEDMSSVPFT